MKAQIRQNLEREQAKPTEEPKKVTRRKKQ